LDATSVRMKTEKEPTVLAAVSKGEKGMGVCLCGLSQGNMVVTSLRGRALVLS
jgi:hypothetical protein